jgi:hypothetical protein
MKDVVLALSGVVIAGIFGLILDNRRRTDDRQRQAFERTIAIEDRSTERSAIVRDDTQARREKIYLSALSLLLTTHAAFHRAQGVLWSEAHAGGDHPFDTRETLTWAIREADGLWSVQAELELFGSEAVAEEYAMLMGLASALRNSFSMAHDWNETWNQERLEQFDAHYDAARKLMRSELTSLE